MKILKIPDHFKGNELEYSLLKRTDKVALIGVHYSKHAHAHSFETHLIRKLSPFSYKNVKGILLHGFLKEKYDEIETLAENEEFGLFGWSWMLKADAEESFNNLVASA